jgi:uncharacterized protein (TIGR02757 family)
MPQASFPSWQKEYLDEKANLYNRKAFIETDPISVPHQFTKKEDIEIIGFLIATLAWGNRKIILQSGQRLIELLEAQPYDFILHHSPADLKRLKPFVHRTFNSEDLQFFLQGLQGIYRLHGGLEAAFSKGFRPEEPNLKGAIVGFRKLFFEGEFPSRTAKHVSNPEQNSACKRIHMYLRWMVRKDNRGVDFGLWNLPMSKLSCPLDLHSGKVARKLGLLKRTQDDWKAVEELDAVLRLFDSADPVKYDFALFGISANPDWELE